MNKVKINKIISIMIINIMILTAILPSYNVAQAVGYSESDIVQEGAVTTYEVEDEIKEELGLEEVDELEITITKEADDTLTIDSNLETDDLELNVTTELDIIQGDLTVVSELIDEHGDVQIQEFDVILEEVDEDVFIGTFIDVETGESYHFDTTELQASAVPLIVVAAHVIRFGVQSAIKKYGKKIVEQAIKKFGKSTGDLKSLLKKKSLGRGSTGRTTPKNLEEQLAMKEVLSSPLKGAKQIIPKSKMNDKRWLGKEGWVKMQRIIKTSKGNINIHFNYNTRTGKFDDFKFK